ncbi:uncharacterized protein LOC120083932 [Benincasa hispida]|uniref:uncharacterized protein LOC120083932 n=1 Tax=Benincasa hispida TaxID=102211 RepID=UPI00190046C0|nr:uncharacterized protein LOC120083932 [Benincasa hispida]
MAEDAAAAGGLIDKSYTEAKEILDCIAKHNMECVDDTYDGRNDRRRRSQNVNSVDANAIATLSTQVATMTSLLQNITLGNTSNQQKVNQVEAFEQPMVSCVGYGNLHSYDKCPQNPQSVYFIKNNPFSKTYNPGWRNHPNFSWTGGNQQEHHPGANHQQRNGPPPAFQQTHQQHQQPFNRGGQASSLGSPLENLLKEYIAQNDVLLKSQASSITNLEIQEQCHVVTLRSGRALEDRRMNPRNSSPSKECITRSMDQEERTPETRSHSETSMSNTGRPKVPLNTPFPRRLMKKNDEHQFKRFLELLKQLLINIPLIEALEQMPTYTNEKSLLQILKKHKRAIGWTLANIRGISPSYCMHKIRLEEEKSRSIEPQRRLNPIMKEVVKKEILKWLDAGVIYSITESSWILIDPKDQEKTTFTCPFGTFSFRRMPFGLCNALGTFQRCMMAIFSDFLEKTDEVFMDNFSVFGDTFQSCLDNLEAILARCEETNLVLNWEKCHFMVAEGIFLGHKVSKAGLEVDEAKIDVIAKLPPPANVKTL